MLSYSVLGNILSLVVACMETCSMYNGAMWVGCVYPCVCILFAGQLKTSTALMHNVIIVQITKAVSL